jgi:UMP-CMP kinase
MIKSVYFVLGGPGSGKGTFCANLARRMNDSIGHMSAGELLRQYTKRVDEDSFDAELRTKIRHLKEIMEHGRMVPAEVTVSLLMDAIRKAPQRKVFIDGFPRNFANKRGWHEVVDSRRDISTDGVIHLCCS